MEATNCREEVVIKLVGRLSLDFPALEQHQLNLRNIIEEVLYKYNVTSEETGLITTDIDEKLEIFFASKKLEGMSNKTIKNYYYILSKFATYIRKPLSTVTAMDMRMYLAVIGKNIKANSINAIIYCFKSFFSWLVDNDYILKNPMNKLKATKVPKRIRNALTEEEIELLRQACKTPREESLLEFLVSSGCRLSEVVNINKDDIDWHEMSLNVVGKGNKERTVYFNTKAKILLQKYIKIRKDITSALFVTSKKPYRRLGGRSIEIELKKIAKRANFDKSIYPHLCRHSFATSSINAGMPLDVIQEIMGHENASTTLIYAQLSRENIKHEYKRTH